MSLIESLKRRVARVAQSVSNEPVSADYRQIDEASLDGISRSLRDSWQDASIPEKQRAIVDPQLKSYRDGKPVPVFDALVEIITSNIDRLEGARVLEVGCSSGYYSEVFSIKGLPIRYAGCDYSAAFIGLARRLYPGVSFDVQDATSLQYGNRSFDIVVSGGCILHIPEYERAIAEASRVSRRWVIFHRTPVLHVGGPMAYTKKAYGIDSLEVHFNEQALVRLFTKYGMRIVDINTHSIGWEAGRSDALAMKTYLCEKIGGD